MAKENAVYRRNGEKLDYICTADVARGDVITLANGLVGIAEVGGVTGELIALTMDGVFEFKTDAAAIAQGVAVYVKANGTVSATATGNTFIGTAWSAATAGEGAVVMVKLNSGSPAAASGTSVLAASLDLDDEQTSVPSFDDMTGDELKAYAKEHNIDLSGATKVADIRDVIKAAVGEKAE